MFSCVTTFKWRHIQSIDVDDIKVVFKAKQRHLWNKFSPFYRQAWLFRKIIGPVTIFSVFCCPDAKIQFQVNSWKSGLGRYKASGYVHSNAKTIPSHFKQKYWIQTMIIVIWKLWHYMIYEQSLMYLHLIKKNVVLNSTA